MNKRSHILRPLVLVLLAAMLITTLLACGPGKQPDEKEELIQMIENGAMTYTVIRADGASAQVRSTAVRLCAAIKEKTGLKQVPIKDDYVNRDEPVPTDTLEILVGMTNREESIAAHSQLSENQYIISVVNNRLVIIGYDEDATEEAVEYFITNILEQRGSEGVLAIPAKLDIKNTYTPPLVNPFDPNLPIFPEQNKPTTTPLQYVKPTYSLEDGMYVQEYKGLEIDGVKTTFQTSTMYSELFGIHSDSVMVYSTEYKNFADWYKPGTYVVDMMIAINRATSTYIQQYKREDDIQKNRSGEYLEHSSGGSFYMVPTERWIEYVWEYMLRPVIIACHPQTIALEEPEMWSASGYSESFKKEWEAYYDEPWQDPASSAENMLKANLLKTYLFERIITELSARIKELSPTTQVYIATHSTVNYSDWAIDAGLNHYVATGALDGVIGQTWSDTHNTAFPYRGTNFTDNFTNAFIEYSSYVDSVEGLNFYALADPMMDNKNVTEEDCQYFYRQSIAATLLQPEINRFQILPWVNRAFANVSNNYRTIQSQIFEALNSVGGKEITIEAGTPGITYLISDSLSWMNTGDNWALNTTDGLYGIMAPLVRDGVPTKMKSMDQIKTAEDLEGVTILVVSYDSNVPLYEEINIAIADWVKAGGTLLFLSGSNEYWDVEDYFFWKQDGTPLNNLLKHLGLSSIKTSIMTGNSAVAAEDHTLKVFNDKKIPVSIRKFVITFEGAENPILMSGDNVIGIDEPVGKGNFIAVGLPSAAYSNHANGPEMIRALTDYALQYTDYSYCESDMMVVRRGDVVAAHAFDKNQTLYGTYINLYSAELTVLEDPTVLKNDSVVLYDISSIDLSVPRLGFTAGRLQEGSLSEAGDKMTYTVTSAGNTILSNRILLPDGVYPQNVTIVNTKTSKTVSVLKYNYDEDTHTALVMFDGGVDPLTVTITFGSNKESIESSNTTFEEISVLTNDQNQDEKYLIHNTAGVNTSVRYCDNDGQVIYRFDLTKYTLPTYYFHISQNYILEISADGESWTIIADYSDGGKNTNRITNADNATVIAVNPEDYDMLGDELYVRLRNTVVSGSHGGAISRITIRHTVDNDFAPEIDQAPGKNNTSVEIIPSDGSASTDDSKYITSTKNGISYYKRTVKTNHTNEDAEFLEYNSAGVNSGLRYCDQTGQLIYAFNTKDMLSAIITFTLSQNYILEISTDGVNYEIVADYSQGGKIPHLTTGGNNTNIKVDLFAYGAEEADVVYVRLRNTDPSKGWGGSIHQFVMEYSKKAN
jgi:hypothetical protein